MRDSFDRIARFIGKTPMLRLWGIEEYFGLHANLYAKLERFNPSGSIKDRTALFMVEDAFRKSLIRSLIGMKSPPFHNIIIPQRQRVVNSFMQNIL